MKTRLIAKTFALSAMVIFILCSCGTSDDEDYNKNNGNIAVTFESVKADGSDSQTTKSIKLTFDRAIEGLAASNITLSGVSGVSKGTLSGSNPYYLPISGFTSGGTLNVTVSKTGYNISGSPKKETIYYYNDGGSTSLIGTWVWLRPPNEAFTLVFNNKEVTFTIFNSNTSAEIQSPTNGTYTISGNTVTLNLFSTPSYFTISGNKLISTANPSDVVYIKQ